jgi:hypothetical protein
MAQAADSLDGDQVTRKRTVSPQRIERRHSGAQQRRRFSL